MSRARSSASQNNSRLAISSYRAGDPGASDQLIDALEEPVRANVYRFLGPDSPDADDVVQETLVATLRYLEHDVEFEGNLVRLAITIGRNRCRDLKRRHKRWGLSDIEPLADWLASPQQSVLDDIEQSERRQHLHESLNGLSPKCRNLLFSSYIENVSTKEICRQLGLQSVQVFYYRRTECLRRLKKIFLKRTARRP